MLNNKTEKRKAKMSLYLRFLHQEGKISVKELQWRYSQFAVASIYQHDKKFPYDLPCKISIRDQAILLWTILRLQVLYEFFTVKMLLIESELIHFSTRTVTRY